MSAADATDLTPGLASLERVRSIACDASATVQVALYTSAVKRFLRKDFYWTSVRLFFARGDTASRSVAAIALAEREAEALTQLARTLAQNVSWPVHPQVFRVRLLSPRCARLMRVMRRADHALALLLALELSGRISRQERLEMGGGAIRCLYAVKTSLLDGLTGRANP